MIVTLTPNPSLDRTLDVRKLEHGAVNRAVSVHIDPGGKGVNVTRALRAFDIASRAVIPCGGADGREMVRLLDEAGVPVIAVPVRGRTRSNVTLVEDDGASTKVNELGEWLGPEELAALGDALVAACEPGSVGSCGPGSAAGWAVLCGSLPPGVPDDVYAELTKRLTAHGVRVAVDTSGPALTHAVAAGPDLIKPNREELAAAVGHPLKRLTDVVAAAEELRARGAGAVLASLGQDGAILVDANGSLHCSTDPVHPRSTVGAGDAALAGFLAATVAGSSSTDALRSAVAWGRAAVGLPGSRMPGPRDVSGDGIRVTAEIEVEIENENEILEAGPDAVSAP